MLLIKVPRDRRCPSCSSSTGETHVHVGPVGDYRAGPVGQLKVRADVVGVDMGLDHPLDPQAPLPGLVQVDADVAAEIDDARPPGGFIADRVRGWDRQAR